MARDPRKTAIGFSMLAAVLMLAGKWLAFVITGSTAIFSDAAESLVHIAATSVAAISLWYSLQPEDPSHPYGHGRIAFFSAGLEGGLISIAAIAILYTAVSGLIYGVELKRLSVGLLITALLALVNLILGWYLVRTGKRYNSTVLIANGYHVLTDSWTSWGVVAGVGLVWATDILWLDPAVAIVIGLQILFTAFRLSRSAFHGLMDTADSGVTDRIVNLLGECVREKLITDYHQLRHRRIEQTLWIELHLLLEGDLPLTTAHQRASTVEDRVAAALPEFKVRITAHLEPKEHEAAHPGGHGVGDPYAAEETR